MSEILFQNLCLRQYVFLKILFKEINSFNISRILQYLPSCVVLSCILFSLRQYIFDGKVVILSLSYSLLASLISPIMDLHQITIVVISNSSKINKLPLASFLLVFEAFQKAQVPWWPAACSISQKACLHFFDVSFVQGFLLSLLSG